MFTSIIAKSIIIKNNYSSLQNGMSFKILNNLLNKYISNYEYLEEINKVLPDKKCRHENFPSHISENIVKFALYKKYGIMPDWNTPKGDLVLDDNQIEVKAFTSDGPTSFGPSEDWDCIYFVDAKDFKNKNFKIYEIILSSKDDMWRNIIFSKTKTYGSIAEQNERGKLRANFYKIIKPQINNYCNLIFDDNISKLKFR